MALLRPCSMPAQPTGAWPRARAEVRQQEVAQIEQPRSSSRGWTTTNGSSTIRSQTQIPLISVSLQKPQQLAQACTSQTASPGRTRVTLHAWQQQLQKPCQLSRHFQTEVDVSFLAIIPVERCVCLLMSYATFELG